MKQNNKEESSVHQNFGVAKNLGFNQKETIRRALTRNAASVVNDEIASEICIISKNQKISLQYEEAFAVCCFIVNLIKGKFKVPDHLNGVLGQNFWRVIKLAGDPECRYSSAARIYSELFGQMKEIERLKGDLKLANSRNRALAEENAKVRQDLKLAIQQNADSKVTPIK